MKILICLLFLSTAAQAELKSGYLSKEQQKFYKNDSFDGFNQRERIDSLVVEVNKLHGELAKIRADMQKLRKELDEAKIKK